MIHFKENDFAWARANTVGAYRLLKILNSVESSTVNKPWAFKVYEIDKLSKNWRCKQVEETLPLDDLVIPSGSIYATYLTRDKLVHKHISIGLKNNQYHIHPGTQRYLLNCVEDDFEISALIIDYDQNEKKILDDFPDAKIANLEDVDFHINKSGGDFTIKLNSGWTHEELIEEFALEAISFFEFIVPNSDHSVNIFLDKRHLMSYDNEKPEMNVYVDDIYGWARFIIDYYCERKLTYNGYQTDI